MKIINGTNISSVSSVEPSHYHFNWDLSLRGTRTGFPLLWLHGFMGSSADWTALVDEHFSDYWNILADLPGHGNSHLSIGISFQDILAKLHSQLNAYRITSFIPIGYSMGGRVAFHLQHHLPDQIPALIGISSAPGLSTEQDRRQRKQADANLMDKLAHVGFHSFLKEWYKLPLFQSIHRNNRLMTELQKTRSQNDLSQLKMALDLIGNGALPSLWENLSSINAPVLLIGGSLDQKYKNINRKMIQYLPQGQHQLIKGGDHAFHLEKPLETARLIRQFLRETIEGEHRVNN